MIIFSITYHEYKEFKMIIRELKQCVEICGNFNDMLENTQCPTMRSYKQHIKLYSQKINSINATWDQPQLGESCGADFNQMKDIKIKYKDVIQCWLLSCFLLNVSEIFIMRYPHERYLRIHNIINNFKNRQLNRYAFERK